MGGLSLRCLGLGASARLPASWLRPVSTTAGESFTDPTTIGRDAPPARPAAVRARAGARGGRRRAGSDVGAGAPLHPEAAGLARDGTKGRAAPRLRPRRAGRGPAREEQGQAGTRTPPRGPAA